MKKKKEIEKRKEERCLFVKGNGGRKGRWERRADEVMRYAERRGIGKGGIYLWFISGANGDKQQR